MFFGNPMLKDIVSTAMTDTATLAMPADASDEGQQSMMMADMVLQANSTEELFGMASQVPVEQVM